MASAATKTMSFAETMSMRPRRESGSSRLEPFHVQSKRDFGYPLESLSVKQLFSVDQVLDRYKRCGFDMGSGPGPDGLRHDKIPLSDIATIVRTIVRTVRSGKFVTTTPRTVLIPKDGGSSHRALNLFNACERLVASSVNEILTGLLCSKIHPAFHGYLPELGTSTFFSDIHDYLTRNMSERNISLVELDIRQAFDMVSVNAVEAALVVHNIPQDTVNQIITISGAKRDQPGIPQGNALGPILFTATLCHHLEWGDPKERQTGELMPVIYADNICLIAKSPKKWRELTGSYSEPLAKIGLQWGSARTPANLSGGGTGTVMGTNVSIRKGKVKFTMTRKTVNKAKKTYRSSIEDIDPTRAARDKLISIVNQWGHIAATTEDKELLTTLEAITNQKGIVSPDLREIVNVWRAAGSKWLGRHSKRMSAIQKTLGRNSNPIPDVAQ